MAKSMARLILLFFLISLSSQKVFPFYLDSESHYSYKFKTIQTEHFDIHYPVSSNEPFFIPQNMAKIAEKAALYFEDAFRKLSVDLNSTPYLRIQVVLIDNTDYHNGFATPVPQNTIYIYVVPPLNITGLGDYDNWLKETATHELTHIISLSSVRGYSKLLRKIFGTVVAMNGTAPLNLIEGLAVFEETNFSTAGRGRSTMLHTLLRASEYEGKLNTKDLYSLDRSPYITEEWPFGQVPYLYGYLLYEHVAKKYERGDPGNISKHNSGVIPYFTSVSFMKYSQKDIPQLWEETISEKSQFYRGWINDIQKKGETKVAKTIGYNVVNKLPVISPDRQKIAFFNYSPDHTGKVLVTDLDGKKLFSMDSLDTSSIKWLNNEKLLYTRTVLQLKSRFLGLYLYDLKKDSASLLGNSERIDFVEPVNETSLCTVRSKTGVSTINIEAIDKNRSLKTERTLYSSSVLGRISHPVYNNSMIYFIDKEVDKANQIKQIDKNGNVKVIYSTDYYIHSMSADSDGNLVITGDMDGVSNVYTLNPGTGELKKKTNLVSGAFDAVPVSAVNSSVPEYLITYLKADGYYLGFVNSQEKSSDKSQAKLQDNVAAGSRELQKQTELSVQDIAKKEEYTGQAENKNYSMFKTLLPKLWVPYMSIVDGGFTVGGLTYGADPLFRSQYTISADYDSRTRKPGIAVSYIDQHFYPIIELSSSNTNTWFGQGVVMQDFDTTGTITLPFSRKVGIFAGMDSDYTTRDYISTRLKRVGALGGLYITSDPITPVAAISSVEKGYYADLAYYKYPKGLGSNYDEYDIRSNIKFFLPMLFEHHVLAVNNDLGYSYGNPYQGFLGGGEFTSLNLSGKTFLLRGYPVSYFYTRELIVTNIEYRFPIIRINSGKGYFPLFLRTLHGAIISDNGFLGRDFSYTVHSYGMELRANIFVLYHIPVTLRLGLYKGSTIKQGQFFTGVSMIF